MKKTKPLYFYIISAIATLLMASGCIEDGFMSDPSATPEFSVDTLKMGVVFTDEQSATHRFTVYNPHNKGLNISKIAVTGDNASLFRVNVDGMAGTSFNDIEIRANDSIYVFVSADLPGRDETLPQNYQASLDFMVNGRVSSVVLSADGQDIRRLKGEVLTRDTRFTAKMPYQVTDSLVVEYGASLTLEPGTKIMFHDNASLIVRGTLVSKGTAQAPVHLTGDRMGNVITDVSFDLMSRQWGGIVFVSTGNYMEYTEVSNTTYGVVVYGDGMLPETDASLSMTNCRLHNSGENVITSIGGSIDARGCEFAEASSNLVYLVGGFHTFDLCTAANNYLFTAVKGAAWVFLDPQEVDMEWDDDVKPTRATITNSITHGLGSDVYPGDLTGRDIYFRRCLFRADGTDDDNFVESIWNSDPLFYTVRSEYLFDYRLKPDSPAIGAAYNDLSAGRPLTDFYGVTRNSDLGAYVFVAPTDQ